MITTKNNYQVFTENNTVVFNRNGKRFFSVPAAATVNNISSNLTLKSEDESKIVYEGNGEIMTFSLYDDCIVVEYNKTFSEKTPIYEAVMFTGEKIGMKVENFDRTFCPQPHGNGRDNMTYYDRIPDVSAYGYNSPSALEITLGSADGWVSIGLLDLPDSKYCKALSNYAFLLESCGGNKVVETYKMPRLVITFPETELDGINLFREKLEQFGEYTPKERKLSELPDWWKNTFVCTYGDQVLEKRVGQKIDDPWVREFVEIAEKDWGMDKFNLIIDDSWQLPHSFMPIVDEARFPEFRKFMDDMHEKGHHVILWTTPLFDKTTNGFPSRAQELGVLSDTKFEPPLWGNYFERFPGCYAIDYTHDNARQFIREVCEFLFGNGEGQLNADGVKMDFLGLIRDPVTTHYAHPEKGMGMKELYVFYELLYTEAKKVKPDVLIDCTVGDPRFEHLIDFNRLHDTHCGTREKEIRADIIARACPNLPIDSDGCLMYNSWLATHYISSSVYGISSNYYVKKYHDKNKNLKREPEDMIPDSRIYLEGYEKKAIGNLFKMSRNKPDGIPYFESFGNWVLKDGDKINAISQRGETVVYYPTETNDTGYIFTFQDETIFVPLHGRKLSELTPEPTYLKVDYARDRAIMRIKPGVVHTFKNIDGKDGIDRIFRLDNEQEETENMVDYVNE